MAQSLARESFLQPLHQRFLVPKKFRVPFPVVHAVRGALDGDQIAGSAHLGHFITHLDGLAVGHVFVAGAVYEQERRHVPA